MPVDTIYKSAPFLFKSHGVVARPFTDRAPEATWLSLLNCEEREEDAISSRFGSSIVNRDPVGTHSGQNYFTASQINTIARLKGLNSQVWRYFQSGNQLYRRAGNAPGQYNLIYTGLSGNAFSAIVNSTFASGTPYLFIADSSVMLKDIGTGVPSSWGILPPTQVAYAIPYAPQILQIDNFLADSGYTTSGMGALLQFNFATVHGTSGQSILSGNYEQYACTDNSIAAASAGMLGVDISGSYLRQLFYIAPNALTFDVGPLGNPITAATSFILSAVYGSVPASSTGTIGKTVALNLGNYQPDDLFVLAILVTNPAAVQEIRVQFDVSGSGYTSSYYYKSLVSASYQSAVTLPQTTSPVQATNQEVFSRAAGVTNLSQINSTAQQIIPNDDPSIPQLQPTNITTGESSWTVAYLRLGDFLPVGNAGNPGMGWANVTGWQIMVITNAEGTTGIEFNALYLQGSPTSNGIGTNAGPSSYGGLGYDYRYTFYNQATQTESNPCGEQYFSATSTNPGATSTLIPLRQAINVAGQYSPDPQVTHVRAYRRGGVLSQNWQYLDQFVNITGSAAWAYQDIIDDATIEETNILNLANDVPVTSTLQTPITTTLSAALNPTAPFAPIAVTVAQASAVFVPNQIVVIGTPANLEQVYVVAGGTGTFTACIQLPHVIGEAVQVFASPAQPCNLCALAYGQLWLAGDPNNPHLLYYSNPGYPENFAPQNYIAVSSPADPITAVINFRGNLLVSTLATWYSISPGTPPIAQPTGSKHGLVAPFGWCQTENAIWFRGIDGIREFTGSDGPYRSLDIEWIFQQGGNAEIQAYSPIPFASPTNPTLDQMAFWNNLVFLTYLGNDGFFHRLAYHTIYKRWRNLDVDETKYTLGPALYLEADTNTLLFSELVATPGVLGSGWAVAQDHINNYDDGGWSASGLIQSPINFTLQTPYQDQGAPNNQKQYNVLTIDADTLGQTLTVTLLFDDNNGSVPSLNLGTITSTTRQKFQLLVNAGLGQQAYRVSLQITGAVLDAPVILQADIHYALLAEQRSSFDSYWIKFGQDESKLVKQGYFDYTSTAAVSVAIYADGNTTPYYSFTLAANPSRYESPVRVRFPAIKLRLFRCVMTVPSGQTLQVWQTPQVDEKPILPSNAKGYTRAELHTT